MRRAKLVLALAAVMVAMLMAFSAPALANDWEDRNDRWDRWDDNRRWDNDWNRNWHRDWRWDDGPFINDFADDCEWEWEEEGGFWALGPWGLYWQPWGFWELDC